MSLVLNYFFFGNSTLTLNLTDYKKKYFLLSSSCLQITQTTIHGSSLIQGEKRLETIFFYFHVEFVYFFHFTKQNSSKERLKLMKLKYIKIK